MEVVTFRASSLQEALQQVREQLGPDASVVNTREVKSGALGLFGRSVVEVEAQQSHAPSRNGRGHESQSRSGRGYESQSRSGRGHESQSRSGRGYESPSHSGQGYESENHSGRSNKVPNTTRLASSNIAPPEHQPAVATFDRSLPLSNPSHTHQASSLEPAARLQSPSSTLAQPLASLSTATTDPALGPAAVELTSDLLTEGFLPQQASKLVRQVIDALPADQHDDAYVLRGTAGRLIAERLHTSGPLDVGEDRARVIAFVGATGVGKTTTLAKIAAGLRFDVGLDIGLITIDTFRLGAVDQLLQYAELLSSPLEVVNSPDEMAGAMQRLRECDTVLIDTAGRSPRDSEQLKILAEFLSVAAPDIVQLVVSSTSSPSVAQQSVERYSQLNASNLILSKIDETVQLGAWYDMLQECPLPVSYITHGQQVPQDITIATPRRLSSLLLSNSQHQG